MSKQQSLRARRLLWRVRATSPLLLCLLGCTLGWSASATESDRFQRWLAEQWTIALKRDPIKATELCKDRSYNGSLPDFTTPAWRAESREIALRQLRALAGFDANQMREVDRISLAVLKYDLETAIARDAFPDWQQPLIHIGSLPQRLLTMGMGRGQPFETTQDYDAWLRRLSAAPRIFDGFIANIRSGQARGVSQPRFVLAKLEDELTKKVVDRKFDESPFLDRFRTFPDVVPLEERARLQRQMRTLLRTRVLPAYKRLRDFLRDEGITNARETLGAAALPNGIAWYNQRVREATTAELSVDDIHRLGLEEVASIRGQMDAVRKDVGFKGDLAAFFKHLRDEDSYYFDSAEDLLGSYRETRERIRPLLPKLFSVAPKGDYELRISTTKGAALMSYDEGTVTINWDTRRSRSHPMFSTETRSLHEGSPGHHYESAIALEDRTLPAFRRCRDGYLAHSEGWALYAESLGRELGLFMNPYQWYGRLADEQLRAMRLVVDTGLHARGWTRDDAMDHMRANSSLSESDMTDEVDRSLARPGRALSYKIGEVEIRKLRSEAEAELKEKFDIKAFHEVVLNAGSLPLAVLRGVVQDWIQKLR